MCKEAKQYINNSRGRATVEKPASVCLTWCSVIHQVLVRFVSFEARSPGASEPLDSTHQPANTTHWGRICHPKWHHRGQENPWGGHSIYKPSVKLFTDELQLPPWESPLSPSVPGGDGQRMKFEICVGQRWLCFRNNFQKGCNISEHLHRPSDPLNTSFCFFLETFKSRAVF